MLKEVSGVAAPSPSSSQANIVAKITCLTYFLHVTVLDHIGPKLLIQASRMLTRERSCMLLMQQPAFPTSVTHKPLKHHLEMPYHLSTICYSLPRRRCRSV